MRCSDGVPTLDLMEVSDERRSRAAGIGASGTGSAAVLAALEATLSRLAAALRRRRLATAVVVALVVAACGAGMFVSGGARATVAAASGADQRQLVLAGVAFATSLLASAYGWRVAFVAGGSSVGTVDACAAYAAGSLVNTFSPARLGDGVRAAFFARGLPQRRRVLTAAGAIGALAAARGVANAAVIAAGSLVGAVPVWPTVAMAAAVALGAAAALAIGHRRPRGRLAALLAPAATLVRSPTVGLALLASTCAAAAARVVAAGAIASAVGVPHPLLASLATIAALNVATAVPLTPGGLGITSGAVSLALASRGVGLSTGIAAGIVFHLVETAATFAFAGLAIPLAARPRLAANRALHVALALGVAALVVATAAPSALDVG